MYLDPNLISKQFVNTNQTVDNQKSPFQDLILYKIKNKENKNPL